MSSAISAEAYLNMAFEPLSKDDITHLEGRLHGYRRIHDKDKGIIYVFEPYDLEDINTKTTHFDSLLRDKTDPK